MGPQCSEMECDTGHSGVSSAGGQSQRELRAFMTQVKLPQHGEGGGSFNLALSAQVLTGYRWHPGSIRRTLGPPKRVACICVHPAAPGTVCVQD